MRMRKKNYACINTTKNLSKTKHLLQQGKSDDKLVLADAQLLTCHAFF